MLIYQDCYQDYYNSGHTGDVRVIQNRDTKGATSRRSVKRKVLNKKNCDFLKKLGFKVKKIKKA